MYNSLFTLVRDTAVLRDYTHSALNIIQVGDGVCLHGHAKRVLLLKACLLVHGLRSCAAL